MKKVTTLIIFALVGTILNAQQNVNIPDVNFKNALINHSPTIDADGDGDISTTEAQNYTGTIDVSSKSISDLTGIEAFVNATNLTCSFNQLTSLNISANTALTELWCRNNQLTSLDVSTNTALTIISCRDNQLTNLDISTNTSLIALISHNNQLTSLDVSANTALQSFHCQNNQLTNLDVSANTALLYFHCFNNSLTSLNVANGNNGISPSNLHIVNAFNNPNLTCIQHDTGFDPTTASQWTKDATASWSSTPCPPPSCANIVNIPDANFKNALLAHGASAPVNGVNPITGTGISVIDTDGDGEICLTEAQAYTATINVSNQNVSDLTGIEAFINHTQLLGHTNPLTSIDVSQNTALTLLSVGQTQLTSLDVTTNTALTSLQIPNCQIANINLSNNTALTQLSCGNNQLTSLDVSANTALTYLHCGSNQLTNLNVANGNNGASSSNLNIVNALNNPNLTCIQHDTGFDPTTASNWQKDATAQWSDNCSGGGSPASNIMYVDKNATGSNNGTSWANAYTNLQTALTNVPVNEQIWIAKGTYLPSTHQDRNDFYSINKSVTIYGGFAGTETSLADRDMSLIHTTNATILSGDLNGNDDGNMTFNNSTKTDNSLHIIEIFADNVTIDGLTISDAYADATSGHGRFGAGIWVVETKKDFTLKNSRVKNNTARWATGMVYYPNIADSTKLTIDACIFENNLASHSSATFYCFNQNAGNKLIVEVTNTLFNGNQTMDDATLNRQAYGAPAGWIRADEAGTTTDVSLVNNTFVNNVSKGTNTNAVDFPTFGLTKRNGNFGTINIANNIFWGNTTNGDTTSHAFGNVITTDVSMPTFNIYNSIDEKGFSNIGSSNLINTSNSNPNLTTDFKLQASSTSAIDAGDNTKLPSGITTDLAGNNRIYNTTVDMGCYEYIGTTNTNVLVNSISVQGQNGETTIITNGGTLQMEATVLPSNATDGTYTWSVTNGTGSATIDQNGVLTAISNGTVTITATANDGSGTTGSVVITISNQGSVGINDIAFENLKVYPNPAKDILYIEVQEKLDAIELIDLSGKTIKTFDAESKQLDISNIEKGIYFIKINNHSKQSIQKVIVQ